jgi:adenine phosphoribosyltransferase
MSTLTPDLVARIRARIRDVPDFPQAGILFKDITPVLADAMLMESIIERMASGFAPAGIDVVAGIESRGFIFGAPLALALGAAFVPVRKPGKLPWKSARIDYGLEYGSDALEIHVDAVHEGQRVLIADDVLATGGTARAAADLLLRLGADLAGAAFVVELSFLGGRARLSDIPVQSIITYDD